MQHRMLGAADVLVDVRPARGALRIPCEAVVVRIEVAQVVPGRFKKRVHRIALAARRLAARWANGFDELRNRAERRSLAADALPRRQQYRKLLVGNGDFAARLAVDDRYRRSPIALTRDEPIAKLIADALSPGADCDETFGDRFARSLAGHPTELLASDQPPIVDEGASARLGPRRISRTNDFNDRQRVLSGEFEVALVMGGNAHDGTASVLGQHVVCQPDRDALAGERMDRVCAAEDPLLFHQARALEFGL